MAENGTNQNMIEINMGKNSDVEKNDKNSLSLSIRLMIIQLSCVTRNSMRLKAKLCREYLRLEVIVQLTHLCPNHKITYLIIFHISFCHHNIDFFAKPSIVLN